MLINGKAESIPISKTKHMLEFELPETSDDIPSPRILNSHLNIRFLPKQMFKKKCKIIHVVRNPKDVVVSLYNHDFGIKLYGYQGKWENFLQLFLEDKCIVTPKYSNTLTHLCLASHKRDISKQCRP